MRTVSQHMHMGCRTLATRFQRYASPRTAPTHQRKQRLCLTEHQTASRTHYPSCLSGPTRSYCSCNPFNMTRKSENRADTSAQSAVVFDQALYGFPARRAGCRSCLSSLPRLKCCYNPSYMTQESEESADTSAQTAVMFDQRLPNRVHACTTRRSTCIWVVRHLQLVSCNLPIREQRRHISVNSGCV